MRLRLSDGERSAAPAHESGEVRGGRRRDALEGPPVHAVEPEALLDAVTSLARIAERAEGYLAGARDLAE